MAARDLAVPPPSRRKDEDASGERPRPSPALEKRYRSLFVLGKGGMGTVEAALEVDTDRVVALKRLLPDSARDARRVEMFLREARLAAMLDHPNVVRAFDYGEIDGELFLAMEYVEGQPLSRLLRTLADASAPPLAPALVAYVLAEVCEGLHAAHELHSEEGQPLHLVHRDVSPQNVMLGYDGHVRLLDFGVAKIEAESVTKTGEVKGKTAYMSPEQAMGEVIDRRSDLFGVGALLFECLVLRRMWGDGTDMEVIRKLALEEPPPLDDVPPAMDALYTRLVARDAKDRPATARAVAEELRSAFPYPGGPDEACTALRELLAERFAEDAIEQRGRLASALDHVASPEKAREIRESVSPSTREVASARASRAAPPPAPVGRAGDALAAAAPPPRSRGRARVAVVAVAAAAVAALVAWRVGGAGGSTSGGATPAATTAATTPTAPTATPPTTPTATSIPLATSTAANGATGASATRQDPTARPGGTRIIATPSARPSASPATSARPAPAPSNAHSAGAIDDNPL